MLPMLRDREGSVPRLSRLDQLFNETLADWFGGRVTEALERGGWFPAVDIREEEGVLTLTIPKTEAAKPHKISIR